MSKRENKPGPCGSCGPVLLVGDVMKDIIVLPDGKMRRGSDRAADFCLYSGRGSGGI